MADPKTVPLKPTTTPETAKEPHINLPPPHKSIAKGTPHHEKMGIWAQQYKRNVLTCCSTKGCYYPLTPVRDLANGGLPKTGTDDEGKRFTVGVCSWDSAHGEQPIYPPKAADEL